MESTTDGGRLKTAEVRAKVVGTPLDKINFEMA
jgi:hypothetical protein